MVDDQEEVQLKAESPPRETKQTQTVLLMLRLMHGNVAPSQNPSVTCAWSKIMSNAFLKFDCFRPKHVPNRYHAKRQDLL